MVSKTATVEIDEQGRCVIPVEVRRALDFDGERVFAEVTVKVEE
jgi:bifunctional DNA-binding transcriptional regulator/antitoxin component of YhaV-PrlF toxin-antitoxin module